MNDLPIYSIRDEFLAALAGRNRVIVSAPTGSGKSTGIPQFLLDSPPVSGQILILEPRRLAARMLAERVAAERGQPVGRDIGYVTRFESSRSADTRVLFITEGILPRILLSDPTLRSIGAVVFDEFHERSLATDLSLALVCSLQDRGRPDLKLVAMSATLDTARLAAYLENAVVICCQTRTFPVDSHHLQIPSRAPPWELAADALKELLGRGEEGDVLVFMPGVNEIRRTIEACRARIRGENLTYLSLYGDMPGEQQHQVMARTSGRRIIVATNIAESSLTVPGVRHVIDSGLARVSRHDPGRGFNTLVLEPISRASAEQRAGRAGREQPGTCTRLWTMLEHNRRPGFTDPEVKRVDLGEAVLHLRMLGYPSAAAFPWFEAPEPGALRAAQSLLTDLGALAAESDAITPLGTRMAAIAVHPRLARMLLESTHRGCLRDASLAAAILSERSIFLSRTSPTGSEPDVRSHTRAELTSDLFRIFDLLHAARTAGFDPGACTRLGINASVARLVFRTQAYFVHACRNPDREKPGPPEAHASAPAELLKCLLLAYPDRLARRRDKSTRVCELRDGRRAELPKESVVQHARLLLAAEIRETGGQGINAKAFLDLVSEVNEEWLRELFPDQWRDETALTWNEQLRQVEVCRRISCLGLLLEETEVPAVGRPEAADLLARKVIEKPLPLAGWNEEADAFVHRVRWVAEQFPERGIIRVDDQDRQLIVHELCAGEWRYERIKAKPVLPLLHSLLSWEDQQFMDRMAPEQVPLPSGRRLRLRYRSGQPPRGNARLQDLYGLRETPVVANGRAKVLLEILAPNMRPVQITDDLAGFWEKHYPAVKKSLAKRYPKHEWR